MSSSQSASVAQQSTTAVKEHVFSLHASVVHTSSSSQSSASLQQRGSPMGALMHVWASGSQESTVQASRSAQSHSWRQQSGISVCWQPVAGSQVSSVHGLVSSQSTAEPIQVPSAVHFSSVVQALSSEHGVSAPADCSAHS